MMWARYDDRHAMRIHAAQELLMKMVPRLHLLALSLTSFCVGAQSPLIEVIITPDAYHVGSFKSPLATPVVDEVVRAKPARVLISTCVATPPAKVLQFEAELKARHQTEMTIALSDKLCVSA